MAKITVQQYAEALYDSIHQTKPQDHDKVLDNFVKVLIQNGDVSKYGEIEQAYRKLDLKSQGISEAEVTFAREVQVNKQIMEELNKVAGGKVEVKKKVDQGILGGIIIKVDDTLIDASVKTQLNHLNKSLKE